MVKEGVAGDWTLLNQPFSVQHIQSHHTSADENKQALQIGSRRESSEGVNLRRVTTNPK